jgi:hypothetical protein
MAILAAFGSFGHGYWHFKTSRVATMTSKLRAETQTGLLRIAGWNFQETPVAVCPDAIRSRTASAQPPQGDRE